MSDPIFHKQKRNPIARNLAVAKVVWQGLKFGLKTDQGMQQWSIICLIFSILAFFVGESKVETTVLLISVFMIFITEILNTALETTLDRITDKHDEIVKNAKDLGAAAVFFAFLLAVVIWVYILI